MPEVNFQLPKFNGPLDLLLSLIDEKKLSITEIALSEVTEQFLLYLEKISDENADELADFLVVATKLLLLKSKSLLPDLSSGEGEEKSLENQLRLYKAFVDASKDINEYWLSKDQAYFRIEPPKRSEVFSPPENFTTLSLEGAMRFLVRRLSPPKPLPETRIDSSVSLKDKLLLIRDLLKSKKNLSFYEVVQSSSNKTELIVCFLAILELMKERTAVLSQTESFGDITIKKMKTND